MGVGDVNGGFRARRVVLPASGVESWTVIGPDLRPVARLDEYLAWLTHIERSPNTVEAQARDLRLFWTFLAERRLGWGRVDVQVLGEFTAWARRPAENVVVLHERAARRSAGTVNRVLSSIVGFYEFQGRRGNTLAQDLVEKTRCGYGGYKPFLGISCRFRGWCHRPGRGGQRPASESIARAMTAQGEW
jgi:integrase/recombinase XerD